MFKIKRSLLAVIAPIALFGLAGEVQAQASDVDCDKCVDSKDLGTASVSTGKLDQNSITTSRMANQAVTAQKVAKDAVTTAKIKNGAVTLSKVAPKLRNSIGTYCAPGSVVVGMDNNGNWICETTQADGLRYFPYGPQNDVHPSRLNEWEECFSEAFNNTGTSLTTVLGQCNKSKLAIACRPDGDTNLTVVAMADRADILTDTGSADNGVTTLSNGSEWYFNTSWSWGFAAEGDSVSKFTCDTDDTNAEQRMCMHTGSNNLNSGYRCGTATGTLSGYQRIIYHAD